MQTEESAARTIAVTGAASGMGKAAADRLRAAGHRVIGVDLREAEVIADLSTDVGRRHAIDAVLASSEGRLDGAVCAAGLGPVNGRERLIAEVNYRGSVDLLTGWRPALARGKRAKAVIIGSNSTTVTPLISGAVLRAFFDNDLDRAVAKLKHPKSFAAARVYAASKIAVTRWARREATSADWAGAGIRLNVLAPGAVRTPLLDEQLAGPDADRIRRFPIPIGEFGEPDLLASWIEFMLSPAADFLVGSFIVVDGGSDALLRANDWPRPVPVRSLPTFLTRMSGRGTRK